MDRHSDLIDENGTSHTKGTIVYERLRSGLASLSINGVPISRSIDKHLIKAYCPDIWGKFYHCTVEQ